MCLPIGKKKKGPPEIYIRFMASPIYTDAISRHIVSTAWKTPLPPATMIVVTQASNSTSGTHQTLIRTDGIGNDIRIHMTIRKRSFPITASIGSIPLWTILIIDKIARGRLAFHLPAERFIRSALGSPAPLPTSTRICKGLSTIHAMMSGIFDGRTNSTLRAAEGDGPSVTVGRQKLLRFPAIPNR